MSRILVIFTIITILFITGISHGNAQSVSDIIQNPLFDFVKKLNDIDLSSSSVLNSGNENSRTNNSEISEWIEKIKNAYRVLDAWIGETFGVTIKEVFVWLYHFTVGIVKAMIEIVRTIVASIKY